MVNEVKRFSDFAEPSYLLEGEKKRLPDILDKEIKVVAYRINNTKLRDAKNDKCMTVQFELDGQKHIFFTGSMVLMEQLQRYDKNLPFMATVTKVGKCFSFS